MIADKLGNQLKVGEKVIMPRDTLDHTVLCEVTKISTLSNPAMVEFSFTFQLPVTRIGRVIDVVAVKDPELPKLVR